MPHQPKKKGRRPKPAPFLVLATRYYQPLPWLPLKTPAPPWQLASAKPSTATAFPHTSIGIETGMFTVLPLRIDTFPTLLK